MTTNTTTDRLAVLSGVSSQGDHFTRDEDLAVKLCRADIISGAERAGVVLVELDVDGAGWAHVHVNTTRGRDQAVDLLHESADVLINAALRLEATEGRR